MVNQRAISPPKRPEIDVALSPRLTEFLFVRMQTAYPARFHRGDFKYPDAAITSVKLRAHADDSERPHHRAERYDGDQRYEGADDADHDDVAIAFPVRRSADREQCDHRTIMRQAIERA